MISKSKAREILHDKKIHGKPITDKQRRYFGAVGYGQQGGTVDPNGYLASNQANWQDQMIIPGGNITTEGMGIPILANGVPLYPNTGDYQFNTPHVVEQPLYWQGGRYRTYQQGGIVPVGDNIQANEDYYKASAQLSYYKNILNDKLKAKNPQGFQNYFQNLSGYRRTGDQTGAESYVQNADFNDYLSPQEVNQTLGSDYNTYLNSLKTVNDLNVRQGKQPLYGNVEGEGDLNTLNYGRRFASLQVTPTYSSSIKDEPNQTYNRTYKYNPDTRQIDIQEAGNTKLRPASFKPVAGQPMSSRLKKGGKYRKC